MSYFHFLCVFLSTSYTQLIYQYTEGVDTVSMSDFDNDGLATEGGFKLANCPAAFLSYFHCGFVMKYSRRWEPSIRLSKMFEPFLWLEMTNLRAVFG